MFVSNYSLVLLKHNMHFQAMQYEIFQLTFEIVDQIAQLEGKVDQRVYRKAVQETICIYIEQLRRNHILPRQ